MSSISGFNVQDFRASILNDGVMPINRFVVSIPVLSSMSFLNGGTGVSSAWSSSFKKGTSFLQYRAESIRLPGASLDTFTTRRYGVGPYQKYPTNVNFTDITITFLDDSKASIWRALYDWQNKIFDYGGNSANLFGGIFGALGNTPTNPSYSLNYKDDYVVDIIIDVYNQTDTKPVQTVMLKQAYPITVNDVPMDWAGNNQLLKVQATFTFSEWTLLTDSLNI